MAPRSYKGMHPIREDAPIDGSPGLAQAHGKAHGGPHTATQILLLWRQLLPYIKSLHLLKKSNSVNYCIRRTAAN